MQLQGLLQHCLHHRQHIAAAVGAAGGGQQAQLFLPCVWKRLRWCGQAKSNIEQTDGAHLEFQHAPVGSKRHSSVPSDALFDSRQGNPRVVSA